MLRNFFEMVQNRCEIKKYLKCFSQSMFHKLKQKSQKENNSKKKLPKAKVTPVLNSNETAL